MEEYNEEDVVELNEINIFAKIPENTARLTLTVQYFDDDGNPQKAQKVMNAEDIRHARKDFLDYVEDGDDYDARYVITEEGKRWLEELERSRRKDCE